MNADALERFRSYFNPGSTGECWEWTGSIWRTTGYGRLFVDGRYIGAHRVAWALANGRRPEQLPTATIIRHRCDNPTCVNPAHLEPGTTQDNTRDCVERHRHATAFRGDVCQRGHDITNPDNVYASDGRRQCAICNRAASRRVKARRRAAA